MRTKIEQQKFRFAEEEVGNQILHGTFIQDKIKEGWFVVHMYISQNERLAILILEKTSFELDEVCEDEFIF